MHRKFAVSGFSIYDAILKNSGTCPERGNPKLPRYTFRGRLPASGSSDDAFFQSRITQTTDVSKITIGECTSRGNVYCVGTRIVSICKPKISRSFQRTRKSILARQSVLIQRKKLPDVFIVRCHEAGKRTK